MTSRWLSVFWSLAADPDVGGDGPGSGDGLLRLRHGVFSFPRRRRPRVQCQLVYTGMALG